MPFTKRDAESWKRALTRVLIAGDPNSRKTSSLVTFPRPLKVIVAPGEKGSASLPMEDGIDVFELAVDDPSTAKPTQVVRDMDQITLEVMAGKHGEVRTLAVDGLHHYYTWCLGIATGGANLRGEEFDAKCYARAHEEFKHFLTRINMSKVPYVVCTVWAGREADNPEARGGASHIFPDLPGKMAKGVLGEFGVVVHADVSGPPKYEGTWQLLPEGKVWGAGVKVPVNIAMGLPKRVPQDWSKLEPLLTGEKEVTS